MGKDISEAKGSVDEQAQQVVRGLSAKSWAEVRVAWARPQEQPEVVSGGTVSLRGVLELSCGEPFTSS